MSENPARPLRRWWPAPGAVLAAGMFLASPAPLLAASPFDTLLGSWGGSGTMKLQDGSSRRLNCNTYYTGGGSQLGMVIRCTGDNDNKIEIRSKLTLSGGQLSGRWEERTYNAEGSVSGKAGNDRITMAITGGGLTGNMAVTYSSNRQDVAITTQGIPLTGVNIRLSRQR